MATDEADDGRTATVAAALRHMFAAVEAAPVPPALADVLDALEAADEDAPVAAVA